jgi:hypothetical protein
VVVLIHGGCWLSRYDIGHLAAGEQAIAKLMGGSPKEHPERYAAVSPTQLAPIVAGALQALFARIGR